MRPIGTAGRHHPTSRDRGALRRAATLVEAVAALLAAAVVAAVVAVVVTAVTDASRGRGAADELAGVARTAWAAAVVSDDTRADAHVDAAAPWPLAGPAGSDDTGAVDVDTTEEGVLLLARRHTPGHCAWAVATPRRTVAAYGPARGGLDRVDPVTGDGVCAAADAAAVVDAATGDTDAAAALPGDGGLPDRVGVVGARGQNAVASRLRDRGADGLGGDGTPSRAYHVADEGALRDAMADPDGRARAGTLRVHVTDSVELHDGAVRYDGDATLVVTADADVVVDAGGRSRLLDAGGSAAPRVVVAGGTWTGGYVVGDGGAVVADGDVVVDGAAVVDSTAEPPPLGLPGLRGGTAGSGGAGGAVASLTGAVAVVGDAVLSGNTAQRGGGAAATAGGVTVAGDAIVADNTATGRGGGVAAAATLRLDGRAVLRDNTAGTHGGGGHTGGDATVTADARVEGNEAVWGGGGVAALGDAHVGADAAVTGNTATGGAYGGGDGGGVAAGNVDVAGEVADNSAAGRGGGVAADGVAEIAASARLSANTADGDGAAAAAADPVVVHEGARVAGQRIRAADDLDGLSPATLAPAATLVPE